MVAIRTFIGVAALATAVLAAPTASKDMSSDCVSSGGSGCGSDMSKMDDSNKMDDSKMSSDCGDSGCGSDMSKMDDSNKMDMGSNCGDSGCGSDMSKMDDSKKMDMGSDCGESGCGDDKKMDMGSDCGESGCGGDKKMDMGSDCVSSGGSGCDKQTSTAEYTSTSTSSTAYSTATYGSGSSNWKMYDDCVSQCVAKFGSDSKKGSDSGSTTASATVAEETTVLGQPGKGGATHTVVVAPTQGVLRFVPFAVMNAAVGDTIKYEWHANNHTVTKGSALELCNKSKTADTFASGLHNKGTVYFQTVNTTDPVYIYCANPGHCQKGMFGVINPKTTNDPALSMEGNMGNITSSDVGTMAAKAYNDNMKSANNAAMTWGNALSLQDIDPSLHAAFAQNVQLTRSLLAMNPDFVGDNGSIKLDTTKNVAWPQDLAAAVGVSKDAAAAASSSPVAQNAGTAPSSSADSASASAASTSAPAADKKSGARGLGVSGAAVAFVAVAASLLAL